MIPASAYNVHLTSRQAKHTALTAAIKNKKIQCNVSVQSLDDNRRGVNDPIDKRPQ